MPEESKEGWRVQQSASPQSEEGRPERPVSDRVQRIYDILARRNAEENGVSESLIASAPAPPEFDSDGGDGRGNRSRSQRPTGIGTCRLAPPVSGGDVKAAPV